MKKYVKSLILVFSYLIILIHIPIYCFFLFGLNYLVNCSDE
jgi:hypothetical protein